MTAPRPFAGRRRLAALSRAETTIRDQAAQLAARAQELAELDDALRTQGEQLGGLANAYDELRAELGRVQATNVQLAHRAERAELLLVQTQEAHAHQLRIEAERRRVLDETLCRLRDALGEARTHLLASADTDAHTLAHRVEQLVAVPS